MEASVALAERAGARFSPRAAMGLAVLVRLALALAAISASGDPSLFSSPDTSTYLAHVDGFRRGAFEAGGEPAVWRTPGYPLFLLPGVVLGHVEVVTIALQILLGAASAWLVYRLALLLFDSPRIGVLAALLYALEPLSILLSVKLLSETLFTFLLLVGLYGVCHHRRHSGWLPLVGAAVAIAAAAYVRPIGYYLPLVLAPFVALGPDGRIRSRRIAAAAAFLVLGGALVGAWQVRNYRVAGYPRFSAAEDMNLWLNSFAVLAREEGVTFLDKKAEMGGGPVGYWKLHPEEARWPMKDRLAHMRTAAVAILLRQPLLYLEIHLAGSANALLHPGARGVLGVFGRDPWPGSPAWVAVAVALAAVLFTTYLLALVGLFRAARERPGDALLLVTTMAYFVLLAGGPIGTSRYRQPLMPLACILAAAGAATLRRPGQ